MLSIANMPDKTYSVTGRAGLDQDMLKDPRAPLYQRLHDQLRNRILSGEWGPGGAMPSEIELARQTGASQGTVRKALAQLCADRLVERRQGRGTFVTEFDQDRSLRRFFTIVDESGKQLEPEVSSQAAKTLPASASVAESLSIKKGESIWRLERLLRIHNTPSILQRIYLSPTKLPKPELLEDEAEIYTHLEKCSGFIVARAKDFIQSVSATPAVAWALGLPKGAPILRSTRQSFDAIDCPIEYSICYINTDTIGYQVILPTGSH